jgi:hypothetical protein
MNTSLVVSRKLLLPYPIIHSFDVPDSRVSMGCRRLVAQGSDYRALQSQVRELQRLLGEKTLEAETLKEALEHAAGTKKRLRLPPLPPKDGSR